MSNPGLKLKPPKPRVDVPDCLHEPVYPNELRLSAEDDAFEGDAKILRFLRHPAEEVALLTREEFRDRINDYFERCSLAQIQPRVTGLALAVGAPGVTALRRMAARRPELAAMISKAMTAVAYWYEAQLSSGASRGAVFALKNLVDYDPEQPLSRQEEAPWEDHRSLTITAEVHGAVRPSLPGSELSPEEAYYRLVQGGEIIDVIPEVVKEPDVPPMERLLEDPGSVRGEWKKIG